ncbi:hypothetical protein [Paenibacillus sp. QZ-Y1]
MIRLDTVKPKNLFLVAGVRGQVVGYYRSEGMGVEHYKSTLAFDSTLDMR